LLQGLFGFAVPAQDHKVSRAAEFHRHLWDEIREKIFKNYGASGQA
jgi:hypothetical protein